MEGELTSPFQRSLRSLPPLLGLRPATKGTYPLGTPNSVSPNAVVLRGNLTESDGEDVLSTTLLKDKSPGTDTGKKVRTVGSGVEMRSSAAAEENDEGMACRIRTGAKTLPDALNSITVLEMLLKGLHGEGFGESSLFP